MKSKKTLHKLLAISIVVLFQEVYLVSDSSKDSEIKVIEKFVPSQKDFDKMKYLLPSKFKRERYLFSEKFLNSPYKHPCAFILNSAILERFERTEKELSQYFESVAHNIIEDSNRQNQYTSNFKFEHFSKEWEIKEKARIATLVTTKTTLPCENQGHQRDGLEPNRSEQNFAFELKPDHPLDSLKAYLNSFFPKERIEKFEVISDSIHMNLTCFACKEVTGNINDEKSFSKEGTRIFIFFLRCEAFSLISEIEEIKEVKFALGESKDCQKNNTSGSEGSKYHLLNHEWVTFFSFNFEKKVRVTLNNLNSSNPRCICEYMNDNDDKQTFPDKNERSAYVGIAKVESSTERDSDDFCKESAILWSSVNTIIGTCPGFIEQGPEVSETANDSTKDFAEVLENWFEKEIIKMELSD